MKTEAILLITLLGLTACSASDEDEVKTAIREGLAQRGTVLQVEIVRRDEDHMTGFAILRNHAGDEVRMNCTVERESVSTMMNEGFSWRCLPAGANARTGRASGAGSGSS